MKNWINILSGLCLLLCINVSWAEQENLSFQSVELKQTDRVLIMAPHPDDEVLGCAGIIQKAVAKGLPVRIVFFTYGDNNELSFMVYRGHPVIMPRAVRKMGLIRHDEAIKADNILGVLSSDLVFLGYPDFGTLNIWKSHWGDKPPFKSMLTKVEAVSYVNAFRPGAPYKGEEILRDLETILQDFKPTKIFLSHPADHNVDHQALYLFTRVALWDLEKEMKPELYPYLVHFKNWPKPRGYYPDKLQEPPLFFKDSIVWKSNVLDANEVSKKKNAIMAHHTQFEYGGNYLLSFVKTNELFGDFAEVLLTNNAAQVSMLPERDQELIDKERTFSAGIEEKYVEIRDGCLEIILNFSKPIAKKLGVSTFIFGYRSDLAFAKMPKLHIKIGDIAHEIYDRDKIIKTENVQLTRSKNQIKIKVDLKVLENPSRIITSTHTYLTDMPLDWISWRILKIQEERGGGG